MHRSDNGEVASVKRRDCGYLEAFGESDDRGVDSSERQVAVSEDELRNPQPLGCSRRGQTERSRADIAEKPHLGRRSEPCSEEVRDLADREQRDDQGPGMGLEKVAANGVVPVVGVDIRVERPGVNDERYA